MKSNQVKFLIVTEFLSIILSVCLIVSVHIYTLPMIIGLLILGHLIDYGIMFALKSYSSKDNKDKGSQNND